MKYYLECVNCGRRYEPGEAEYLCSDCAGSNTPDKPLSGILKIVYDYTEIRKKEKSFQKLQQEGFLDLLPLSSLYYLSTLRVGNTPLYKRNYTFQDNTTAELYLKDDSQNPTYSYKDRASSLVCALAAENDIETIIVASTGNAGSSLAGIGASLQQKIIVLVPETAPVAKLVQMIMYGAEVIPIQGDYDAAFDLSVKLTQKINIYNRNTGYNPFTVEGKKTAVWEIFAQMNERVPDRIFIPAGDGCILSGIYKGWEDLLQLGIIKHIPQIIAVQSAGSSNLIDNLNTPEFIANSPDTVADSISVKIPSNFYMSKKFLQKYQGSGVKVTDNEIKEAAHKLASNYGLFAEPAAAAAFAGFIKYSRNNKVQGSNVILLTGSGLKDISAWTSQLKMPASVKPELNSILPRLENFQESI